MKKFEGFGKQLSKTEQKKVMGGLYGEGGGDCPWTYSGCNYNEDGYLVCDYVDCHGASHCGYTCMHGDGGACRSNV